MATLNRHPSDILPNQEGPLFRLKDGIRERLSKSGQGTITLGAPMPGNPGPEKLTPEKPFVRGGVWGRYHSELDHIPEEDVDLEDYIDDVDILRQIETIDVEVEGASTDEPEEDEEPDNVESQFSAMAEDDGSDSDEPEQDVELQHDETQQDKSEPETDQTEQQEDEEESSNDDSTSFDEIGDQFAAISSSDNEKHHQDYEQPGEEEPESPVTEDVGVDKLPGKDEVKGMLKEELKKKAESLGVLDDVPPNENGHVTKKNIKEHLIGLIEEDES